MKNMPWYSKLALGAVIFLPLWFVIGALGTKFGVWTYAIGLVFFVFTAGTWLLGIVALIGVVALIMALLRKPRSRFQIGIAAAAIILPAAIFAQFIALQGTASDNPIHDVATDTSNPPEFSPEVRRARLQADANRLNDYQTPLRELDAYASSPPELGIKNHAQIITESYAELSPLPLGGASREDAVAAVAAAMGNMGFADIRTDAEAGRVEGVAETFWYGFKDDVVARIGENQIDFRSVSRVGRSDLGANAARIAELRERVAEQIGQR